MYPTSRDVNQSLLNVFNLVDLWLIVLLMWDSPNIIVSAVHCFVVKGRTLIKENEVESLCSGSLTMLHVPVHCPDERQNVICNMFDNCSIRRDTVVKCLSTDCVYWIPMMPKETSIIDMVPDIMADTVNANSVHQMAGRFVPCLGTVWCIVVVHSTDHITNEGEGQVCLWHGDNINAFCMMVNKAIHNI